MRTLNPSWPEVIGVETVAEGTVQRSLAVERGQALAAGVVAFDRVSAHLTSNGPAVVTVNVLDPANLPGPMTTTRHMAAGAADATGWTVTGAGDADTALSTRDETGYLTGPLGGVLLGSWTPLALDAEKVVVEARVRSADLDGQARARFVAGPSAAWDLSDPILVGASWTTIRVILPGAPTDSLTVGDSWRAETFTALADQIGIVTNDGTLDVAWLELVVTGRADVRRAVGHVVTSAAAAGAWTPYVPLGSPVDSTAVTVGDLQDVWVTMRAHPSEIGATGWVAPTWRHLDNGLSASPAITRPGTDAAYETDADALGTVVLANSDLEPLTGSQPYDTITPSAGTFDLIGRADSAQTFQLVRLTVSNDTPDEIVSVSLNDVRGTLDTADATPPTTGDPKVGYAELTQPVDVVENLPWLLRVEAGDPSVLALVHTGPLLEVAPADGGGGGGGCVTYYQTVASTYATYADMNAAVSVYLDFVCTGTDAGVVDDDQLGDGTGDDEVPTTGSWSPVYCRTTVGTGTGGAGSVDPDSPVFIAGQSYTALAAAYATYSGMSQLVPSYLDLIGVGAGIGATYLPGVAVQAMAATGLPVVINLAVTDRAWFDTPLCPQTITVPRLTWSNPSGLTTAATVEVERYDEETGAWRPTTGALASTAAVLDHESPRNRVVRWRVRLSDADRVSAWANSVAFINPCPDATLVFGSNTVGNTLAYILSDAERAWSFAEGTERIVYADGGGDVFVPLDDGPETFTRELYVAWDEDGLPLGRAAAGPLRELTRSAVAVADSDGGWWWAHVTVLELVRASDSSKLHTLTVQVDEVIDSRVAVTA